MSESHSPDIDDPEVVHEESDVNVSAILRYGLALLVAAVVIHVLLFWLVGAYERQYHRAQTEVYPMASDQQDRLPPEPRLQDNPQGDLRSLRSRQDTRLHEYGWVNKEAGIARIPIEEAMRIVVQKGLPARQEIRK
jgi:hypothetical protein